MLMENGCIIAFAIFIVVICLLSALYQMGGILALVLGLALLAFVVYKIIHWGEKPKKYYDQSDYIRQAMQFIEFYETIPCDHSLVITEYNIGVVIKNKALGEAVLYYNSNSSATTPERLYTPSPYLNLLETLRELTGEKGVTLYREWNLLTKIDSHDKYSYQSVFYTSLPLPYQDKAKKDILRYADAIERQYRKAYQKTLQLCIWENDRLLNI